jgi:CheY-like chemotaxis protein
MTYSIKWYESAVEIIFSGNLIMQEIDNANYAVNSDERFDQCKRSVWDFRNCKTDKINVNDLYSAIALDVGASALPGLRSHQRALIANDPHTIRLCESYMREMKKYTNWSLELFDSFEETTAREWCDVKLLPAVEGGGSQCTLLIVDAELNIHLALRRILQTEGYNILTASASPEALELLAQHSIGVIMCDQRLPTMSGVDFLRQVKNLYPETVRVLLSGQADLESLRGAINQGSVCHLMEKPWDDNLLRQTLRDAFDQYSINSRSIYQADS